MASVRDRETKPESALETNHAPSSDDPGHGPKNSSFIYRLQRICASIDGLAGFEARGIRRVTAEERQPASLASDLQVFLLWLSANLSLNNLGAGLLGPLVFGLGFKDSVICAVLGAFLGSLSTAYMCTWGPKSGNRTMVSSATIWRFWWRRADVSLQKVALRFFMGYWPAKIPCALNIILMIGYCTIDAIIAGQVLSAVSGGGLSIAVGVVIISAICWIIATFGMYPFQVYERWV